ncbi:MAG: magnesium transporter [Clostridiales bacterium]|nr:magnesium transporter [Clostridiales bacterium]
MEDIERSDISEKIKALLSERRAKELREFLAELNPVDIAEALEDLEEKEILLTYRLLPKEYAADLFVSAEPEFQELLIRSFSDVEIRNVMDDIYLDEAADLIEEMPANVVARILKNTDSETRKSINALLLYPEDSAGSIMTPEYVSFSPDISVEDAFAKIRKVGVDKETVYTCYVTDNRKLIGVVSVRSMLISDKETKIADIMHQNFIAVETTDDKEFVAAQFQKYGYLAIPVVDKENRLVGIVTIDDALEVMGDEATEDIEKMAAILPTDKPYLKAGVFSTWAKRIPWLLLLMVSATFTSKIINSFENALMSCVVLTAFIPMIMDTGGNAGGQSSVTIIRGLSIGDIELSDIWRIIWKEVRVAFLCGLTIAPVAFAKVLFIDGMYWETGINGFLVAAVVSLTLLAAIVLAKFIGCTLPLLAKLVGFDPAVMASPFITTIVDALSLLLYFGVASALLGL